MKTTKRTRNAVTAVIARTQKLADPLRGHLSEEELAERILAAVQADVEELALTMGTTPEEIWELIDYAREKISSMTMAEKEALIKRHEQKIARRTARKAKGAGA